MKIGNDILEIEGSTDADEAEPHYWINFEYQGALDQFAGFPQQLPSVYKLMYTIDLSSKYSGQSIIVQIYKEFIRVKFHNASKEAFGKTVGLLGDFETTVMNDFIEFGHEWQVLPSEPRLFHELASP